MLLSFPTSMFFASPSVVLYLTKYLSIRGPIPRDCDCIFCQPSGHYVDTILGRFEGNEQGNNTSENYVHILH